MVTWVFFSSRRRHTRYWRDWSSDVCSSDLSLLTDVEGSWFTSHVNENVREIAAVAELFDGRRYLDTYDRHGLIGRRSVLAHNVHPSDDELACLAARGARSEERRVGTECRSRWSPYH